MPNTTYPFDQPSIYISPTLSSYDTDFSIDPSSIYNQDPLFPGNYSTSPENLQQVLNTWQCLTPPLTSDSSINHMPGSTQDALFYPGSPLIDSPITPGLPNDGSTNQNYFPIFPFTQDAQSATPKIEMETQLDPSFSPSPTPTTTQSPSPCQPQPQPQPRRSYRRKTTSSTDSSATPSSSPKKRSSCTSTSASASTTKSTISKEHRSKHNSIEKRYRVNLNSQIYALWATLASSSSSPSLTSPSSSPSSPCSEYEVSKDGKARSQQQPSKAAIIASARRRILRLEAENKRRRRENAALEQFIKTRLTAGGEQAQVVVVTRGGKVV